MSGKNSMTLSVMRYNPERDAEPHPVDYVLPFDDQTSLLDALQYVKDRIAPDLSFRSSCRMAICGSCGLMVDGLPKLACKTFLRSYTKRMRIEALGNFPIERDLVVDLTHFLACIEAVKPYVIGNTKKPGDGTSLQSPARMERYHKYAGCINCGLCYAACPQFGLNPEFIGPAAATLAHRYNRDSRDRGSQERLPLLGSTQGVWNCTFVGLCSQVCPKQADPAGAVQQCKADSALDFVRSVLSCRKTHARTTV